MTSLPLYVPQLGQARCGSLGALHWGQTDTEGAVMKSCARRIFLRDLDVFFLGTAMFVSPFILVAGTDATTYVYRVALKSFKAPNLRLTGSFEQEHGAVFISVPQVGHNPLHPSEQSGFNGISMATCSSIS